MKQPRVRPSSLLPPVQRPKAQTSTLQSNAGKSLSWLEGFTGTSQKELSAHALRLALATAGAPLVYASPLPTVARVVASNQLSSRDWVTAGTVETHGVKYLNFFVENVDINENGILARPFWIIESERFIDDFEDPYVIFDGFSVRIPVVCDAEVVGLEVMDFTLGQHALYNVGVGFTP